MTKIKSIKQFLFFNSFGKSKKYSFLLIKAYEGTPDRYYINFDKVVFDDDKKNNELESESN